MMQLELPRVATGHVAGPRVLPAIRYVTVMPQAGRASPPGARPRGGRVAVRAMLEVATTLTTLNGAKALAVPLLAYGVFQRRGKAPGGALAQPVSAVRVRNQSTDPIMVQGYGARDSVKFWPVCRVEILPGGEADIEVPPSPFGRGELQLAIRLPYCAKLLHVKRGATLEVRDSLRGEPISISCQPRRAVVSTRDISHWSRAGLPHAGDADLADIDGILGQRSRLDRIQVWAAVNFLLGTDKADTEVAIPLKAVDSEKPQLPKLLLGEHASWSPSTGVNLPPGAVVIGTVRCGYGHHRIALALASYGSPEAPALLHDFAALDGAPPVELLRKLDETYSRVSRMASEDRTKILEVMWNQLMASGDANASRSMRSFCERLKPLLLALPPDTPIIAAHTFVAVTALLCGCKRIINIVFDNHAQPVHVAPPPAINVVQTPKCQQQLLELGVPASHIQLVGHFIPKALSDGALEDSRRRVERAERGAPRRFLFSVGGAGAQRSFLTSMIRSLLRISAELPQGLEVIINVGDHEHVGSSVFAAIEEAGVPCDKLRGLDSATQFVEKQDVLEMHGWPGVSCALFSAGNPMEATAVTDVLVRNADVLVTKPSELAFYPIPKLHISRIGNHEMLAAVRSHELGDGTAEARSVAEAAAKARFLATDKFGFIAMCEAVERLAAAGVYDGARRAFELAVEKAAA